ncbi:hypothetical protein OIU85_007141 [Salix viminalis]|uniref:Endonuclease/exonuclease/phosphatase domain-containing protein n=1 Tax=Salix viminalis TaxID=40686 RepID=A0A9Q0P883_SALVM|nr:hypothetical protein OIU85_007141 [Salix viminalis]
MPMNWAAINNVEGNSNCRILVGWNTRRLHVQCIHASDQWITCDIRQISSAHVTRITFVYGSNNYGDRIALWQYLGAESATNASIPWSILGDFNAVLRPNDRSGGSNIWQNYHNDFPNCIMGASLHQIPYSGTLQTIVPWCSTWTIILQESKPLSSSLINGLFMMISWPLWAAFGSKELMVTLFTN